MNYKRRFKRAGVVLTTILMLGAISAHDENWALEGSAFRDGKRLVLTPDEPAQGGAAWASQTVDLSESFTLDFLLYLGEKAAEGADGIAFILTPLPEYRGGIGGSLGTSDIEPRVAIGIHTYQGPDFENPQPNRITPEVVGADMLSEFAPQSLGILTDGSEHRLRISWSASSRLLRAFVGNETAFPQVIVFLPSGIFPDETSLSYGFTGATGGLHNLQYVVPLLGP